MPSLSSLYATQLAKFSSTVETTGDEKDPVAEETEKEVGQSKVHHFQAETQQLLDIVAKSLYRDREVFLRELISNASDALEKVRFVTQSEAEDIEEACKSPRIDVAVNEEKNRIVIQDNGIGMNESDLIENLGTIARSGTKAFLKQLEGKDNVDTSSSSALVGQFGVGFYSAFMVARNIRVYTRSARKGSQGYCWKTDGSGEYSIVPADGVAAGTKIVIDLRDDASEFSAKSRVESIIHKYSNFIGYDINLNGEKVNTVKALWTLDKNSITEEQHVQFYQFLSNAMDKPMFRLHYSSDSPLSIRSLLYIPTMNMEKILMERTDPGINLYSKKVMIMPKAKDVLPEYLRFIKGVVDCEDLPLNISRENYQDSLLMKKIKNTLTKRIIKWLDDSSREDPEKYQRFFNEFGYCLKEGVYSDFDNKVSLAKLLRFESNKEKENVVISLDDYVGRMQENQNSIYYVVSDNRDAALSSPYLEIFKKKDIEVLLMYNTADDIVMSSLREYADKSILSVEAGDVKLDETKEEKEEKKVDEQTSTKLVEWMKEVLKEKVEEVKVSSRLYDSPAIIVDHDPYTFRRMKKMMSQDSLPQKSKLEINPEHPILRKLSDLKDSEPDLAANIAEQVYDNAAISAGIVENYREVVSRMNSLLASLLNKH